MGGLAHYERQNQSGSGAGDGEVYHRAGILADNERSFYNMADINRAHVLMLVEESIIPKEVGVELLKALNKMQRGG